MMQCRVTSLRSVAVASIAAVPKAARSKAIIQQLVYGSHAAITRQYQYQHQYQQSTPRSGNASAVTAALLAITGSAIITSNASSAGSNDANDHSIKRSSGIDNAKASPFVYPELQAAIAFRQRSAVAMQAYMRSMQPEVAKCRALQQARATACFELLRRRVEKESAAILYGFPNAAEMRALYVQRFGCAAWTDEALDELAKHSPLLELGAGAGQWQQALVQRHGKSVDVVAFDNGSSPSPVRPQFGQPGDPSKPGVAYGDERMLSQPAHAQRTLLLCYPPPLSDSAMAMQALQRYKGSVLLYVGEGRGGVNAGDAFFDVLERDWSVERTLPLQPFPSNCEKLFVLKRRSAATS